MKILVQSAESVHGKKPTHTATAKSKHTHTELEICIQVVCVETAAAHPFPTHIEALGRVFVAVPQPRDERAQGYIENNAEPRERFVCEDSSAFRFV